MTNKLYKSVTVFFQILFLTIFDLLFCNLLIINYLILIIKFCFLQQKIKKKQIFL